MQLVKFNDPILYTTPKQFDFANPPMDPKELFVNLKAKMIELNGLGLSANQVGIPYAVFVFGHPSAPDQIASVFNPKIVDFSTEKEEIEEGCLSIPGLVLKISRHTTIRVRYTSHNGVTDSIRLGGLSARIFQHEMCHMMGRPFYRGSSKLKLEIAARKCAKRTGIEYSAAELFKL